MENNKIERILEILPDEIERYDKLMQAEEVDYEAEDINRYETVKRWTANFGNGYEMDLKVCSSDSDEPLWCETVLFLNGSEVDCSEVYDELEGEWQLYHNDVTFILQVLKAAG